MELPKGVGRFLQQSQIRRFSVEALVPFNFASVTKFAIAEKLCIKHMSAYMYACTVVYKSLIRIKAISDPLAIPS